MPRTAPSRPHRAPAARRRVLAAGVAVLALAGCGGGSGDAAGPGTEPATTEPAATAAGDAAGVTGDAAELTLAYAGTSDAQTLDLYLPPRDGAAVPLVVLVHGGGFLSGSSEDLAERARTLVDQGFAAASLDYRLSGEAAFPAGAQDVKAAVRFLRAGAGEYGIDPDRFGIWGESAGGYLAAIVGATQDQETLLDGGDLGNEDVAAGVSAVVSWFGPVNFATLDEQAVEAGCTEMTVHAEAGSPESLWLGAAIGDVPDLVHEANVARYVTKAGELPAYYLVHGDRDCTVAPGQSLELQQALESVGADVQRVVVEGAGHDDDLIVAQQTDPSIAFLAGVLEP